MKKVTLLQISEGGKGDPSFTIYVAMSLLDLIIQRKLEEEIYF